MDSNVESRLRLTGYAAGYGAVPAIQSIKMLGTVKRTVGTAEGSVKDPSYIECRAIGGNATLNVAGGSDQAVAAASGWVLLTPITAQSSIEVTVNAANAVVLFRSFGGSNGGPRDIAA